MDFNLPSLPSLPSFSSFSSQVSIPENIQNYLIITGNVLTVIISIFAIFFLFLISYSVVRILEIRKQEEKFMEHEIARYAAHQAEDESKSRDSKDKSRNPRWEKVLGLVYSENDADWKLAIIEADSMLDNLMDQMGFRGESLGDKLKSADRDKFKSLSDAWEAHAIRNRIAHEGSEFELPAREAKRVITLYEHIFREFGFI